MYDAGSEEDTKVRECRGCESGSRSGCSGRRGGEVGRGQDEAEMAWFSGLRDRWEDLGQEAGEEVGGGGETAGFHCLGVGEDGEAGEGGDEGVFGVEVDQGLRAGEDDGWGDGAGGEMQVNCRAGDGGDGDAGVEV